MNPAELIRKKRDGGSFTREEIRALISSYTRNILPEYQMSALLMAIYFKGLSVEETSWLTDEILHSGECIDLSGIGGIKVDVHSTGGVGDKVPLVAASMAASCGVPVPMIGSRGLSHTGGILDKLESIPGFRTQLSVDEFAAQLRDIGIVIAGASSSIIPADRRLYALLDVTATIDSIPLIASSILSKKLAEGIDALVFDVKTGHGAFMPTYERAAELAQTLVNTSVLAGKKAVGYLTEMNQPLGRSVGNWLEVTEAVECLKAAGPADVMDLAYRLGSTMLLLGGKAGSEEEGRAMCQDSIASGAGYNTFCKMVERQGGDLSYVREPSRYRLASLSVDIKCGAEGFIAKIDAFEAGMVALELGAGRLKITDTITPGAGIVFHRKAGDAVAIGDSICTLYTDKEDILSIQKARLARAIAVSDQRPHHVPTVRAMVDGAGVHPLV